MACTIVVARCGQQRTANAIRDYITLLEKEAEEAA